MSKPSANESPATVRHAIVAVVVFGLVGALVGYWLGGAKCAGSIAIGASIGAGNLWLLAQMVRGFLGSRGASASWVVVALLKFVLLFSAMYVLVKTRAVDILPCAIGFGALPVGIVFAQLMSTRHEQKES